MVASSLVISHCCEQIFIDARLKATIKNSRQKAIFQFANILRSILIAIDRRHSNSEYVNLFVRLSVTRTFDLQPHSTSSWLPEFDLYFQSLKAKYGSRLKEKVTFNYEDFPLSTGMNFIYVH